MKVDREWVHQRLSTFYERKALVVDGSIYTFAQLSGRVHSCLRDLDAAGIRGNVVILDGDYSEVSIGTLLALWLRGCIVVPVIRAPSKRMSEFAELTGAEFVIDASGSLSTLPRCNQSPLLEQLRASGEAGLILLSSGSTGAPKAMLLSLDRLLEPHKHRERYTPFVTAAFLLFDHIGGVNTLMHSLLGGGTLVKLTSRDPSDVCRDIATHRIELLPSTPTFLNMLLIRRAHEAADLSSLKLITYGTEVMPERTLRAFAAAFPGVALKQTYGMSELGILSTKSQANDSPWMKLGGSRTKVVDGILWVKSPTAMVGYLNAPSPFDAEGWLCTGDVVDVDGEYIRVHGRKEHIINVAGQKVFPAEVESRVLEVPCVVDAVVWGKKSPVTGFIVAASVVKHADVNSSDARREIVEHCSRYLEDFKVPRFIEFVDGDLHTERFKKQKGRPA